MAAKNRVYRNVDLDETAILVSPVGVTVLGYYIYNAASTVRYVRFYNKQTAATVGTTVPIVTLPIPATSGANLYNDKGLFDAAQGLSVGATNAVGDSDTTATTANDVIVNIFYRNI